MKGVHREFLKLGAKDFVPDIAEARRRQGEGEARGCAERVRGEVRGKWERVVAEGGRVGKGLAGWKRRLEPEMEKAVKVSVESTSRGDEEEDRQVEEAIRASLAARGGQGRSSWGGRMKNLTAL